MVQCQHLFENRIYLISFKSIDGLSIFERGSEKRLIRKRIYQYLEKICMIHYLEIRQSEVHLVLELKERKDFQDFYIEKYKGRIKEPYFIPVSSHIFGRQVSNLLVSFVKSYNWKYKRKGTLIDGRYRRYLIQSYAEMKEVIFGLRSGDYRIQGSKVRSVEFNKEVEGIKDIEQVKKIIDLRGCFKSPFKTSLIPPFLAHKMKMFRANYPCGPNYN